MRVIHLSEFLKDNKQLMKEYNYEKNNDIDLNILKPFSSKKIWWKCKNGHELEAKIITRVSGYRKCPFCNK